jgi:predicted O-methyltransferase YrrM
MELGTSLGISTIYMGLAAPESKILTIEGCIDSAKIAHENFEKSGLHNIQIITGNIDDKLSMAFDEMAVPDLIFIDGNQRKEPTLDYFEQILQHIHPGTVLIIDDIHCSGGMTEAWNTIRGHSRVKVSIDLYQMGIVFFKEELSKEDFILRY